MVIKDHRRAVVVGVWLQLNPHGTRPPISVSLSIGTQSPARPVDGAAVRRRMISLRRLLGIVIPCIVQFFVQTVLEGVKAWMSICDTLYVLFFFFTGRSHLRYPQSLKELRRKKKRQAERNRRLAGGLGANSSFTVSLGEEKNGCAAEYASRFDSEPNSMSDALFSEQAWSGTDDDNVVPECWVQRRLQRGCRGEITHLLPKSPAKQLVSHHYYLCYSESLYRLASNVVGPIQPPTIAVLPTRHTAPQWPPHSSSRSPRIGLVGGDLTLTTDEYSSTTSAYQRPPPVQGGNCGQARLSSGGSAVVYRRESSKRMQFDHSTGPRVPSHCIASITAHHVLSYQATRQKVLIMDLDETLCFVSTSLDASPQPPTFSEVIPSATGAELFHIWERPHLHLFMNTMARLFNLVLFTSSTKPYADSILRRLDPKHLIKQRYYRQHCRHVKRVVAPSPVGHAERVVTDSERKFSNEVVSNTSFVPISSSASTIGTGTPGRGSPLEKTARTTPAERVLTETVVVKDLRVLKVPSELMIMIDNVDDCVSDNRENVLVVPPFFPPTSAGATREDTSDNTLLSLMPFLEALLVVPDVRSILRHGRLSPFSETKQNA
uniref:FCP1 homology domain-containing protein n=1 Tax=Trypanosoma vivax (strain Y486) TaxID=1055687 RepID=G0TSU6_TRYVY|nr:conserved hypothetical protein, fragment [Trypanosoma vivax Y486]